jgi:hypothetical protein
MIKQTLDLSSCYQILRSDFRPTSMEKGQELVRLRIYEVYAWGMPIIITIVGAILDNLPETSTETFLRPRFGENKCWFYGEYFYDQNNTFFLLCLTAPTVKFCGNKFPSPNLNPSSLYAVISFFSPPIPDNNKATRL